MLALVNGVPKILNLKEVMEHYLRHQEEVVVRRSRFDLEKAQARAPVSYTHLVSFISIHACSGG